MTHLSLKTSIALMALAIAVPVFAQTESSSLSSSAAHSKMMKRTVNTGCMSAAVSKRDTTISTALQTVVTALQTRGTALSAAWSGTEKAKIKTDVKAANAAFAGTWKKFDTARKAAWVQFATDAKACKVMPTDAGSESMATGGL
jgi:hypothetical protein